MKISNNFTTSIHIVLRNLIEEKSKRDQINFTSYQLANALCIPRSIITKLTHPDKSKRVTNPRIETLIKIVEFFKADGFNISIDDLLGISKKTIDVQDQKLLAQNITRKIPLRPFCGESDRKLGTIDIKVSSKSKNIFALYADEDIKPIFKKGSIFIIDPEIEPEDDTLVAVNLNKSKDTQIKKYHLENNKIVLKPLIANREKIILLPNHQFAILGVVIQVYAKT